MKKESQLLKNLGKMFEVFRKLVNAVLDRGGDDETVLKLLSNDNLVGQFADVLMGTHKIKPVERVFKTWKTIKLGTLKTVDEIRIALKQNGHNIGDWANDILGKPAFTLAQTEEEIHLVTATVAELGFKDGATNQQIWDRIVELGYELCPAEVGPQLRLQYADQPKGEWLIIAMKPITDSGGDRRVFGVERGDDGDSWLSSGNGSPDAFWSADRRFVFASRK